MTDGLRLCIRDPQAVSRNSASYGSAHRTNIIEDDDAGSRFADALIEKQIQGVHVNLVHDSVGSFSTPQAFFKRLPIAAPEWRSLNLRVNELLSGLWQRAL